MKQKLPEDVQLKVIEDYQSHIPIKEIFKKYNIGRKCFYNCLKRHNIKCIDQERKRYGINDDYFSIIDTEDKAYFLGLLYADGCNRIEKRIVAISLQTQDIDILEKLKYYTQYEGPIFNYSKVRKNKKEWKVQMKEGGISYYSFLKLTSKKMCEDLCVHGCMPRKTSTLLFPTTVPKYLMRHFIRGYIDGDGWVVFSKNHKNYTIGLISTPMFCESFKIFIENELNISCCIHKDKRSKIVNRCNVQGADQFLKFGDWLYKDAKIYLVRKYQKYQEIKRLILERQDIYKEYLSTERKGSKNGRSYLTEELVRELKNDRREGMKVKDIMKKYHIKTECHVFKILSGKLWSNVV